MLTYSGLWLSEWKKNVEEKEITKTAEENEEVIEENSVMGRNTWEHELKLKMKDILLVGSQMTQIK